MDYKITTYSEEETIELAQNIESEKFPNMVICLKGDLGSGKTIFTKGFAQALEVKDMVLEATKITETDYENRKGWWLTADKANELLVCHEVLRNKII